MRVLVYGKYIGNVITNRSLTVEEAMYAIGYDVTDPDDCKAGFDDRLECFYQDDECNYCFDRDAVELDV